MNAPADFIFFDAAPEQVKDLAPIATQLVQAAPEVLGWWDQLQKWFEEVVS